MNETPNGNGKTTITIDARDKKRLDEFARLTRRGLKHTITRLLDIAEQDPEYTDAKARNTASKRTRKAG